MINNNNIYNKLIYNGEIYNKGYYNGDIVFGYTPEPIIPEFILTIKTTARNGDFSINLPNTSGAVYNVRVNFNGSNTTLTSFANRTFYFSGRSIGEELQMIFTGVMPYFRFNSNNIVGCYLKSVNFGNQIKFKAFTNMFTNATNLETVNLNGINLDDISIISANDMFNNCPSLIDINLKNLNKPFYSITGMFRNSPNINLLKSGIQNWDVSNLNYGTNFLLGAPDTEDNTLFLDQLYNNWATKLPNVTGSKPIDFGDIKYTQASTSARSQIISKGWTLNDGGLKT